MKKFLTYSVVIATIVWSLGLAAVVPVASAAYTATAGDLIKTNTSSAVYYIGSDAKRYLMVNARTYFTWYADWSGVETITQDDFDSLTSGANVTVRPGTKLVTFKTNKNVYAVAPGGVLHKVASSSDDAVAVALYGAGYASKVTVIQDSFESNYSTGDALTADSNLPDGSLVKWEGNDDVYYIEDGEKRLVEGDAFVANNFMDSNVMTAPASMTYDTGSSITGEEAALTTVAGPGGATTPPAGNGTLTVQISSTTPATATYLDSQARAVFLIVDLINNSSDDVTIDSFKVERGGIAGDSSFSTIGAYEDNVLGTQISLNKTLNSDHLATFGDDVTVAAGTTKKLVIVGNMAAAVAAGDLPKLGLYSMDLKGDGTLNASLPIWGNVMNLNTNVAIAGATVANGSSNPTTDAAPKVGDTNIAAAEIKITNDSSTEEIQVEKITFKQAGTVADGDISEWTIEDSSDGTILGTAKQVNKYIQFVFTTPFKIGKSKNKSFMVRAVEIVGGSSRTFNLDIYDNTDVVVKGLTYNAYVIPTFPNTSKPYFSASADQTIGDGTVKVEPATAAFPNQNVQGNQSGVQIGEWIFTIKGEGVDISNIEALITTTGTGDNGDITNGIFFNAGATAIGSVQPGEGLTGADDPASNADISGVTSTDTISLPVGTWHIGLKVDLDTTWVNNDTIVASIDPDSYLTSTGQVTGNNITETPTTGQDSATVTIKTASLAVSLSQNPPANNVVRPATDYEAANIQFDASGSGDDVTITQIITNIRVGTMSSNELSNLTLWDGNTEIPVTNNPDSTLSATGGTAVTTTFTLAAPYVKVTKGTVKTLKVTVNIAGTPSANETFRIGLHDGATAGSSVAAKDSEGEDVVETYTNNDGNLMTIKTTGSLTVAKTDTLTNQYISGNTAGVTLGELSLSATDGTVNVEQIWLAIAAYQGGGTDELTAIYLYDGATQLAQGLITTSNQGSVLFNMQASPVSVASGASKTLTIKADTGIITANDLGSNAHPSQGFTPSLVTAVDTVVAKTNGTAVTASTATLTFASFIVVKSVPTVTIAATGDSINANGDYDLIDVTVAASSKGPIGLYKMTFKIATTTVTDSGHELYEDGIRVATVSTDSKVGIKRESQDNGFDVYEVYFNPNSLGGELRTIAAGTSKTYTLKASLTGYTANTSNGVATAILGDDAAVSGQGQFASDYHLSANLIDTDDDDDFIWSDLSWGNTTTTATATAQFMNSFNLSTLGGLSITTSTSKSI